jgi:hypothetical protein
MKPSAAAILALLRQRGERGVTPAEARLLANCDRLAARVCELRAEGHDIRTGSETAHGATYARYRLHERPVQLSAFDSPVSAREVPPLGSRAHQAAERQPQRAAR